MRFLDADYCAESEVGGCGVRNHRRRYNAESLNGKRSPSVDKAQRYDFVIVLRGDESLRRRFFAHKKEHDVNKTFTLPVPLDPAIPLPNGDGNHAALTAEGSQGSKTIAVKSRNGDAWTAYVDMPFMFAGHNRVYTVGGTADLVVPTSGSVNLTVYPELKADVASGVLMDFKPDAPATYLDEAGFSVVDFAEQDIVIVKFTAANAI